MSTYNDMQQRTPYNVDETNLYIQKIENMDEHELKEYELKLRHFFCFQSSCVF